MLVPKLSFFPLYLRSVCLDPLPNKQMYIVARYFGRKIAFDQVIIDYVAIISSRNDGAKCGLELTILKKRSVTHETTLPHPVAHFLVVERPFFALLLLRLRPFEVLLAS